ncbi:hypothetical protein [Serinicoccus hydrothermalis]|nr:hypothetical protein [Serinicoccus hydrothermalis]
MKRKEHNPDRRRRWGIRLTMLGFGLVTVAYIATMITMYLIGR